MVIRASRALVRILAGAALTAAALAAPHLAQPAAAQSARSSLLIWPVDPVIDFDARAAALWLENPGTAPITLQVRIYAWAQDGTQNIYAPQEDIVGSPPMVTIAPGAKQLVRLTRIGSTPPGTEAAYRVVIDEVPLLGNAAQAGAAVSFRMRYSLPLFAYGNGLSRPSASPLATGRESKEGSRAATDLRWRVTHDAAGTYVEIRNEGNGHARLTSASLLATDGRIIDLAPGLLGYVLPGQTMRWPLPAGADASSALSAGVNGAAPTTLQRQSK